MRIARLSSRCFALLGLGLALGVIASGSFSSGCKDSNASAVGSSADASGTAAGEVEITLPGVDTSAMTPRERRSWSFLVGELLSPCPAVPVSVAQCVREKRPCGTCAQAAKWVAKAVREGASSELIEHAYKDRFDPSSVKTLPLDGSPTRGPEDAPVTIVELADFECPHCAMAVPELDAVLAAHPGKVRLVYKSYTLAFHVHGEPAARAAFAAGNQGKFWEMEHVLFEQQQHLEDADIERYARALRLDIPKWKADMASQAVKDRIAADHGLGEQLKLKGTPTLFINGRELDVEAGEVLEDRVASELGEAAPDASAPDGDGAARTALAAAPSYPAGDAGRAPR
ncbi:MAG: DsbA family protein, partial [Polyangiaceae bacterium]